MALLHEMAEMRYHGRAASTRKLARVLGGEPHTSIDAAMRTTLAAMGVLGDDVDAPTPARSPLRV